LYECPDRLWLGSADGFAPIRIVLLSERRNRAFIVDARSVRPIDLSVVPPSLRTSGFAAGELDGAPVLAVSLDTGEADDDRLRALGADVWHGSAAALALHEAFHIYSGQRAWVHSGGSRGAAYPERVAPRYLRAALERELASVVRGPGEDLGPAAHWQQRYETEETSEAERLRDVDRLEGSARYFEIMALALADVGCDATDAALEEDAIAHLSLLVNGDDFNPQLEPYDLGALAGLLLHRGSEGWEADIEGGETMVGRALRGVTPRTMPDDAQLLDQVTSTTDSLNARRAPALDQLISRLPSSQFLRVVLPVAWGIGSFTASDIVRLEAVDGQPNAIVGYTAELVEPSSAVAIHATQATVLQVDASFTACESLAPEVPVVVALIPITASIGAGPFRSTDVSLRFDGLSGSITMQGELPWLCPP
jgi:hypothetical protein